MSDVSKIGTLKKLATRLSQEGLDKTGVHLYTVDIDTGEKSKPIDLILNENETEGYIRTRKLNEHAEPSILSGNED